MPRRNYLANLQNRAFNYFMRMRPSLHHRALICAAIHFFFCLWLGAAVFIFGAAGALADSSENSSWLPDAMYQLFIVLEAPAVLFCRIPLDFFWKCIDAPLVAMLWSLLLGYIVSLVWCQIEKLTLAGLVPGIKT